jgi:hypothetical protein
MVASVKTAEMQTDNSAATQFSMAATASVPPVPLEELFATISGESRLIAIKAFGAQLFKLRQKSTRDKRMPLVFITRLFTAREEAAAISRMS